jgi:hypothetical protein
VYKRRWPAITASWRQLLWPIILIVGLYSSDAAAAAMPVGSPVSFQHILTEPSGTAWTALAASLQGASINVAMAYVRGAVNGSDRKRVQVGVLLSRNAGGHWVSVSLPRPAYCGMRWIPDSLVWFGQTLYADTYGRVLTLTWGAWRQLVPPLPDLACAGFIQNTTIEPPTSPLMLSVTSGGRWVLTEQGGHWVEYGERTTRSVYANSHLTTFSAWETPSTMFMSGGFYKRGPDAALAAPAWYSAHLFALRGQDTWVPVAGPGMFAYGGGDIYWLHNPAGTAAQPSLWESQDGGRLWHETALFPARTTEAFIYAQGKSVWANLIMRAPDSHQSEVWVVSTNQGALWHKLTPPPNTIVDAVTVSGKVVWLLTSPATDANPFPMFSQHHLSLWRGVVPSHGATMSN